MRPEKISVAMVTNDMNINGISTVVMNYCKYLNSLVVILQVGGYLVRENLEF